MSKVLIVSKTKMAHDNTCVGGIDLDTSLPIRLLDGNGYHESRENCPYKIRDIWEINYNSHPRPLPHTEDVRVSQRRKTGILKHELSMLDILNRFNINVYSGNILQVFEGKLKSTNNGTYFISHDNVPQNSTCFWICDRNIRRNDYKGKIRYNYNDGNMPWGHSISYVGLEEPISIIPKGTLIRLSLAHWWSPTDSDEEERCYLQLSGWY